MTDFIIMPQDDKYVVFKRQDFEDFISEIDEFIHVMPPPWVDDAVVLRRQDRFAASAFRAYSGAIINSLAVLDDLGYPSVHVKKQLVQIADYFEAQAEAADAMNNRKLPD